MRSVAPWLGLVLFALTQCRPLRDCTSDSDCATPNWCDPTPHVCVAYAKPGGGSSGDGGIISDGGAVRDITVLSDCQELIHQDCLYLTNCFGQAVSVAACDDHLAWICVDIARSVEKGGVAYNLDASVACRASLSAAMPTCTALSSVSCGDPWTPLVADGGRCETSLDCVTGTCGDPTNTCPTTCVDRGGLYMPCSNGSCTSPLHCNSTFARCENPIPVGSPCKSTESLACGSSASCTATPTGSSCVALPSEGQACTGSCADGLYCVVGTGGLSSVCRARPTQGQVCSGSECATGLLCISGACSPPRQRGGSCSSTSQCASGLYCDGTCKERQATGASCTSSEQCSSWSCDGALKVCADSGQKRDAGEPCGTVITCATGVCRGLVLPDAGVTAGTCGPGASGAWCTLSYQSQVCPAAMRCGALDGGLPNSSDVGTCQAMGVGTPCSRDSDCVPEHYCMAGTSPRCQPRLAANLACDPAGIPCVTGATCTQVTAGAYRCLVPGKKDQPCIAALPSPVCESGLTCIAGTCTDLGAMGGQCAGYCSMGRCDQDGGFDAGLGALVGRCVPPGPPGTPCADDHECASQRCRSNVCGALCP